MGHLEISQFERLALEQNKICGVEKIVNIVESVSSSTHCNCAKHRDAITPNLGDCIAVATCLRAWLDLDYFPVFLKTAKI